MQIFNFSSSSNSQDKESALLDLQLEALDPDTPDERLTQLMAHPIAAVRRAVVRRVHLPSHLTNRALVDHDWTVRRAYAQRGDVSVRHLVRLVQDEHSQVAHWALTHRSLRDTLNQLPDGHEYQLD